MKLRRAGMVGVIVAVAFALSAGGIASAAPESAGSGTPVQGTSAFRRVFTVSGLPLNVPAVVEVPLAAYGERAEFAVYDTNTAQFQPSLYVQRSTSIEVPTQISADNIIAGGAPYLVDRNYQTYAEFSFTDNTMNAARITVQASTTFTSEILTMALAEHVALPTYVTIHAGDGTTWRTVVARRRLDATSIMFPETSASTWQIVLEYAQPLRIAELRLVQQKVQTETAAAIRFLAQPGHVYRIYYNPDRSANVPVQGEAPDLRDDQNVFAVPSRLIQDDSANPYYVPADADNDGVLDIFDNCVNVANPDQKDVDGNGRGDACDDFDRDGVINAEDNCINTPNRSQLDTDHDGIGDACDQEESRFTERYTWVPWAGIVFAAVVLIALFAATARGARLKDDAAPPGDKS
jgi:hypothetical protein